VTEGYVGIEIIDISNPASPSLAGSYDTPGFATGVTMAGDYAYVADGGSGLEIIDISDPASPFLVGTFDSPGGAAAVTVTGDFAYMADLDAGLQVIDISDPTSPFLAGTYNTPGFVYGVDVMGNYAYAADGNCGLIVLEYELCSVTITSPSGGESWDVGEVYDITWVSENGTGSVDIEYSTDGGYNWLTVIANTPDDGSYSWTVPTTPSTNCLVKVCDAGMDWCCDESMRFTILGCCECADCNEDGSTDVIDALWEVNCILGNTPPPCTCDCNEDGEDDILDVLCVVNTILGGSCP
jgi:hypothetical protein